MPQSLANAAVHLVFSTKDREPFLGEQSLREEMHRQLGGASKTLNCPTKIVGGVEDHVHILAFLSRTMSIAEWVKELNRVTSLWVKQHDPNMSSFLWQAGYGTFSVSHSELERVITYIANQPEHHRKWDFQTEFRRLLELHEIEYDERYVWD